MKEVQEDNDYDGYSEQPQYDASHEYCLLVLGFATTDLALKKESYRSDDGS